MALGSFESAEPPPRDAFEDELVHPSPLLRSGAEAGHRAGVSHQGRVIVAGFRVRIARLKRRRAEQDRFARKLLESQEAERKRIAGELHDGIGQTLAIIPNRALLGLRDGPISGRAQRQVEEIADVATGALDEIRKVTHTLRPYQLDRLGLARAIEALVEQAAAATGIEFDSAIDPLDGVFAPENEMNVYRIVQEAVGNLVRHAGAKKARVEVRLRPAEVEIASPSTGLV